MNLRLTFWVSMEDSEIAPIGLHTHVLRELCCDGNEENGGTKSIPKIGEWRFDFTTQSIHRVDCQESLYCEFCSAVARDEISKVQSENTTSTIIPDIIKTDSSRKNETDHLQSLAVPPRPLSIRLGRSNPLEKKSYFSKKLSDINLSESNNNNRPKNLQDNGKSAEYGPLQAFLLQQKVSNSCEKTPAEEIMDNTSHLEWKIDDITVCKSFMQKQMESPVQVNVRHTTSEHLTFRNKNTDMKLPLLNDAGRNELGKEDDSDFPFPQTAAGKQF